MQRESQESLLASPGTAYAAPVNEMSGCFERLAVKTCQLIQVVNWLEKGLNYLQTRCLPGLTGLGETCHKVNTSELAFYIAMRDNSSFRQMVTL